MRPRTDPTFLSKFIRSKKNENESALKSIEKYYEYGNRNLSFFEGAKPSQFTKVYDSGVVSVLKSRHQGSKIAIIKITNWSPKEVSIRDLELACLLFAEYVLEREVETQENGGIGIFYIKGIRLEHIRGFNKTEIHRIHDAMVT